MEIPTDIFKIVCTTADFDNIQQILEKMSYPFRTYDIKWLNSSEAMQNVDILFINCQGPEPTWESAKNIRALVERGGALYVSCYAHKWLDLIFPEYMEFHGNGEIQNNLKGRIINSGLQEFLGGVKDLDLHYDTHWHGIKRIKKRDGPDAVQEYMRGKRQYGTEEEALLVSFPVGLGFVIFTTFHNCKQLNELEFRLLQYLVLRPLLAAKTFESNTIFVNNFFTPTKEVIGTLKVGEESQSYTFFNEKPADLKFIFNWKGKATARATILDPHGQKRIDENIRAPPKEFDFAGADPGQWTFRLKIVDAPLANFPFAINVGLKDVLIKKQSSGTMEIPDKQAKSATIEIVYPERKMLIKMDFEKGTKYDFGRNLIPEGIKGRDSVSGKHFLLTLLNAEQATITDISTYGTGASNYISDSTTTQKLSKNIPVAFKFPILVNLADVILILIS